MSYRIHEGTLPTPQFRQDHSINVLETMLPGDKPAKIVITRDKLVDGETLEQCMQRQLAILQKSVKQYKQHHLAPLQVGSLPAMAVYTEFAQGKERSHQAQAIVKTGDTSLLVFTLSTTHALEKAWLDSWWGMVAGFVPTAKNA